METKKDHALTFFGLAALACLLVSLPATLKAMQLFHGSYGGYLATFVFEIGAVGSEIATLAIPQWRGRLLLLTITLLLLTTGGNYALGIDHFGTAQMDAGSTYDTIRQAQYGWLLAIMSSAIFPSLLLVFLTAFTARWRMVRSAPAVALVPAISNTQINIGVLPRTYAEFTAARAAELTGATDAEIAAALESTPATVRKLLDRVTTQQQEG
jgi:hypothetical protein